MAERVLGKNEVSGSNPLVGSNGRDRTAVSLPVQGSGIRETKRVELARRESRRALADNRDAPPSRSVPVRRVVCAGQAVHEIVPG